MEQLAVHIKELISAAVRDAAPDVYAHISPMVLSNRCPPSVARRRTLAALLEARGPEAVYVLSKWIPHNPPTSPLVHMLLNSSSPKALIQKLDRHQQHFHPGRCLEVITEGRNFVQVRTGVRGGPSPSPAETLFACGALDTLFELIGCRGLSIEWNAVPSGALDRLLSQMNIPSGSTGESTVWRISWEHFDPVRERLDLDDFLLSTIAQTAAPEKMSITETVEHILQTDLTVRHTLEGVSSRLAMSPRTLQRRLAYEGVSFSQINTELRIRASEELMRTTDLTLTDIAQLVGFVDSAHFCRVFRKVRNLSPQYVRRRITAKTFAETMSHHASP